MVRIGIVSTAHLHADAYAAQLAPLTDAQLVGVWNEDAATNEKKAQQYGTKAYADLDALLGDCDGVVICSENVKHRPLTERAAQAGKHVCCEKPLAPSPDDARAMIDACEKAGVLLMTAFPTRFSPAFQQLAAAVQGGEIGEVLAVRGTNRGRCPGGWFIDKALSGGGAVMDHTVHVTDLLRVLLQSEPVSVYCEADNRLLHGDFDDTGFLSINFENGVFTTLDASWSRPRTFPTWGDVTMGVTGTKGVIELDMFAQESTLFNDTAGRISYENWGSNIDKGLVAAFVHSVRTGEPLPITGWDGLRAVEVVEAAYQSVQTGQPADVRRR